MVVPAHCVQVIVVGAGLSGLRAATEIHNAGYSYMVLEAMDRVGGKTLSVPSSGNGTGVVDLGAAWINDSNQSEMYDLAKEFGFDLIIQRAEGSSIFQTDHGDIKLIPYGLPADLTLEQIVDFLPIIGGLSKYVDRSNLKNPHLGPDAEELDSLTALELVEKKFGSPLAVFAANTLTRGLLGVDAHEVSALFLVDFIKSGTGIVNIISDTKDGAQYLHNQQGNQQFSIRLASKLKPDSIRLSSPVKSITQTNDYCTVETRDGKQFCSKKVISSVPTSFLPLIKFDPPLPPAKRVLSESTKLGYYSKTVLVYSDRWWLPTKLSGVFTSDKGPISFTRDTSAPDANQFSITCFHTGEPGREWSKLDARHRREAVLDQFQRAFRVAVDDVPEPINIIEKEWTKDPWARGNPIPVMMPGLMTSKAGQAIRDSFKNIHFVGTETAFIWKGYMEGAVRSGVRGAREVIDRLANHSINATQR